MFKGACCNMGGQSDMRQVVGQVKVFVLSAQSVGKEVWGGC